MRAIVLAAVLGFGPVLAVAGPSDHAGRPFGDFSRTDRREVRSAARVRSAPYALTGERVQRRVLEFRDVPKGRGQTEKVAFRTWVTE
jgi:hypothetical protein